MVLERLIDTLMRTAIEHAGAERGLLILSRDNELQTVAEAKISGHNVTVHRKEAPPGALPESIIRYVLRTRESVILDDAALNNPFSADTYIRQRHARSIFCLPLINQAKLIGMLYLENNLTPHVFTPTRTAVLRLLASQAAISLENTHLYEALCRSESYLTQAQRLAHVGSWAWEAPARNALYISQEWYRIFGFDPKDGMPTWEQQLENVHPDDSARWQATIDRAIAEKSDYDVEFRILPPDGSLRFIHSVGRPVLSPSGELLQFVGVSMDVTESRRAEKERERLREELAHLAHLNRVSTLGELTASLAHEVKQPIGAAVTNADACLRLLDRDQPDLPEAREAAREVVRDARRAADIIDRVRLLYQKGSSQLDIVDINEVIEEMVILLHNEANRHSVAIRTDLTKGLPKVKADRLQLQQALMNLMLNGIEAMRDISGELSIKAQLAGDSQLLISVADTGLGLCADNIDKIFDPFFTTKAQGTGLGLAITRSIITSHGGRIWATPNSGRGATFNFTLPGAVAVAA
jgi:PAS domain S-box-containing protein